MRKQTRSRKQEARSEEFGIWSRRTAFWVRSEFSEADFAFRQAWALCPYSPEALFRYVNLLVQQGRTGDALLIAQTSARIDPSNDQLKYLVESLKKLSKEDFHKTIMNGRPEKGMPPFSASTMVTDNWEGLYAYLKGRSDGKIKPGHVYPIDSNK